MRRPHSQDVLRIAAVLGRRPEQVQAWFVARTLSTESLRDARGLRVVRQRAGLSRAELARAVEVSVATVAHWECGRRSLPARRWPAVTAALGLPPGGLTAAVHTARSRPAVMPLARLRRRSGLSQRQVGERLLVSPGLVSRWERGVQTPGWPHLRRLAVLWGLPLSVVAEAAGREAPVQLDRGRWPVVGVGAVVRSIRVWRGESRAQVARRIGVHPQTLRRWEDGATVPSSRSLAELDQALGLLRGTLPRESGREVTVDAGGWRSLGAL